MSLPKNIESVLLVMNTTKLSLSAEYLAVS